jgi:hypothetical protein
MLVTLKGLGHVALALGLDLALAQGLARVHVLFIISFNRNLVGQIGTP